jgi:hypothetical protein
MPAGSGLATPALTHIIAIAIIVSL